MNRPFAKLSDMIVRYRGEPYTLITTIRGQERSLWLLEEAIGISSMVRVIDVEVVEPAGSPWQSELSAAAQALDHRIAASTAGVSYERVPVALVGSAADLVWSLRSLAGGVDGHVLVDYSCLPERLLFPLVRFLRQNGGLSSLAYCYTEAASYSDDQLVASVGSPSLIPTFHPSFLTFGDEDYVVVLSLGFVAPGVNELVQSYTMGDGGGSSDELVILVPHPQSPPIFQRNWDAVRSLDQSLNLSLNTHALAGSDSSALKSMLTHVVATDVSGTYDLLERIAGTGNTVMIPFGPKPLSLAMALFCADRDDDCAVAIAQAAHLHPRYSEGIANRGGQPASNATVASWRGRPFYS